MRIFITDRQVYLVKILLSLLFLFTSQSIYAQRDSTFAWSVATGASLATGKELDKVYDMGVRMSTAISIPVKVVRITPTVSYNYFGNYYSESSRDDLFFWTLGSQLSLNPKSNDRIKLVPFIGAFYLSGNNYLSPRKGYTGDRIALFNYKGWGTSIGARIEFNAYFFVAVQLDMVRPTSKINDDLKNLIKDELEANSSIYEVIKFSDSKKSFDNVNFSFGYKIPFK